MCDNLQGSRQCYCTGQQLRPETVHRVVTHRRKDKNSSEKPIVERECKFCGRSHIMKKAECPAWGKTCSLCKRKNHVAKKCTAQEKTRKVRKHIHQVTAPDDSDDEWIHTLSNDSERPLKCRILVDRRKLTFKVDTGATVNTLPFTLCTQHRAYYTQT